jgi:IS30 family transposase
MTETEIAEKLNVDQSTISRDIRALKEMSQQFVFYFRRAQMDSTEKPLTQKRSI